jgi:RNA polymerase sigma-32 factor
MEEQIKDTLPAIQTPSLVAARGVSDETGLEQYIQTIQKFPILTTQQEYEYAVAWRDDKNQAAASSLVSSHLRMVVKVAYDFKNYGIPMSELIASGNMGLMQALQKFDPERGFRFSTYAMFWVKAEIYETILGNWSMAKIGTSAAQKRVFFNLTRAKRALGIMDNNLNDDQIKQIADHLNVGENDVAKMSLRMSARDLSLNAPIGGESDAPDMLANLESGADTIENQIERLEFQKRGYELLRKHLAELPYRDREILVARRLSDPAQTLEAVSKKYGISRERVRQIEERAFAKLQTAILNEDKK